MDEKIVLKFLFAVNKRNTRQWNVSMCATIRNGNSHAWTTSQRAIHESMQDNLPADARLAEGRLALVPKCRQCSRSSIFPSKRHSRNCQESTVCRQI